MDMDISLDHLDLQTRKVVLQIMRRDFDEAKALVMSGRRIAIEMRLAELEAQTTFLSDVAMAESIVQAVHLDGEVVAAYQAQEKQAERDRQAALQLEEHGHLPRGRPTEDADIDDELCAKFEVQYNLVARKPNDEDDIYSPPTSLHPSRRPERFRPCLICTDRFSFHDLARLPCAHEYCRGCLRHLFTSALTDETLFPARCCREPIPVTDAEIQFYLGGELVGKYRARKLEMETPNRTYCHKPNCSTFILPRLITNDIATCPKCLAKTCSICKAAAHVGSDCPQDEAAQQLLEMAKEQGWKQCHACNAVVELKTGCNHMTCRCGAEFCYICGAVWINKGEPGACECDLFDEDTLRLQAEREAALMPRFHEAPQAQRQQIVQQRRERIVQNHACEHSPKWRRVDGRFTCEGCNDRLQAFILECKWCDMRLCVRCRVNRLR